MCYIVCKSCSASSSLNMCDFKKFLFLTLSPNSVGTFSIFFFYLTETIRIGTPQAVVNGEFGVTSAPVFLNNIACDGREQTLLDCQKGSRLGLIDDTCICTTQEDCVEDLGIICPGLTNSYSQVLFM